MASLEELRQKFPMYNDLSDEQFISGFHKKFYSDMPIEELHKKIGYDPKLEGWKPPSKDSAGIYARAGAALPGSIAKEAGDTAAALWSIVSSPKQTAKKLYELGWEGVGKTIKDDLSKHYGSMDRVQKTFETEPARFIMDAATLVTGGSALLRKLAVGTAKTGRAAIPEVAAKMSKDPAMTPITPLAFRTAGEAGEAGGAAAQEFRAGVRTPPGAQSAATMMSPERAAGEAIGAGGWMPRKLTAPTLGGAGIELLTHGALPPWLTGAGAATGVAASSPRLMGETMYGLGKMEGAAKTLPRTRTAIAAGALDLLKDREAKKDLSNDQRKTLRAATRTDADSRTMALAARILGSRLPTQPQARIDVEQQQAQAQPLQAYGGTDPGQVVGGARATAQTPSPGEPSQPKQAGAPQGLAPELTGQGPLPTPGQSPGLGRAPTTGQELSGQPLDMEGVWAALLGGEGKSWLTKAREEHQRGAEAFERGGLKEFVRGITTPETQERMQDIAGGFGGGGIAGRTKAVGPAARMIQPTPEHIERLSVNKIMDPATPAPFEVRTRNVRDIAKGLHDRGSQVLKDMGIKEGKITHETRTPETDAMMARTLASEAKEELRRGGKAADWYTKSVEDAVKEASKIFPEIATDAGARTAFKAAKAITSQGETVPSNVRLTNQVYSYFRKNGRFPTNIKADKQKYINNNFKKLNALIKHLGNMDEVSKFMEKEFTVRDLVKAMQKAGIKGGVGSLKFPVDYKVYGSSILGPKIGHGFFQNLIGNYNPVTTDLWLMRTWGRLTGTLSGFPGAVDKAQARLEAALKAAGEKVPGNLRALVKRAEQITDAHEKDFKVNRELYDTGERIKSELTKAAERLQQNLSGIKETPSSGGERVWIAQVVDQARKMLEEEGIKVTNADLQAILWYPEKKLYERLGGRESEGINVNYAQAWRNFIADPKKFGKKPAKGKKK